ncbi:MAG TPA: hypothetical protein VK966_13700 [Longimicrobiales bacterium]|nr:hypothetical protein [Longimicrobiales bacterium]
MGLTTLTELEKRWMKRARRAVDNGEEWEACHDCRRYHPSHHSGPCDDADNRLPGQPEELLAQ